MTAVIGAHIERRKRKERYRNDMSTGSSLEAVLLVT